MNDLHDELQPIDRFEAFQHGKMEGFRFFYDEQSYRIYCWLFRRTGEGRRSRELTRYCFIVLFRNHTIIKYEAQMLRILYMLARMSVVLELMEPDATEVLEKECKTSDKDDDGIMDDPAVTKNEILIAVQRALQMLSPPSAK